MDRHSEQISGERSGADKEADIFLMTGAGQKESDDQTQVYKRELNQFKKTEKTILFVSAAASAFLIDLALEIRLHVSLIIVCLYSLCLWFHRC